MGKQSNSSTERKNNQSPPPKSFGFFKKHNNNNQRGHQLNTNHMSSHKDTVDIFAKKTKEDLLKQAKDKLHQMAQTIEVVNPVVEDNEDIDMLMQLYEEKESHDISSDEDNSDYNIAVDNNTRDTDEFSPKSMLSKG